MGTAIITLPLELPIRVAEDASVLDIMSGARLEVGVAPGGNLSMYTAFGLDSKDRHTLMVHHLDLMRDAWAGRALPGGDSLYPVNPGLADRIWQATFAVEGAQRAGRAGDGLMLSRNQPRKQGPGRLSLDEIQNPLIDAYLEALPPGREPRILASRTVFVADDRKEALRFCEAGFRAYGARRAGMRRMPAGASVEEAIAARDRLERAGAFDRSAASPHPALDRADGPGRGARPRLATGRCRRRLAQSSSLPRSAINRSRRIIEAMSPTPFEGSCHVQRAVTRTNPC